MDTPALAPEVEALFQSIQGLDFPVNLATKYPHILTKMYTFWDKPVEFQKYLKSLTLMENHRQGFHPLAFKEILRIEMAYDKRNNKV